MFTLVCMWVAHRAIVHTQRCSPTASGPPREWHRSWIEKIQFNGHPITQEGVWHDEESISRKRHRGDVTGTFRIVMQVVLYSRHGLCARHKGWRDFQRVLIGSQLRIVRCIRFEKRRTHVVLQYQTFSFDEQILKAAIQQAHANCAGTPTPYIKRWNPAVRRSRFVSLRWRPTQTPKTCIWSWTQETQFLCWRSRQKICIRASLEGCLD